MSGAKGTINSGKFDHVLIIENGVVINTIVIGTNTDFPANWGGYTVQPQPGDVGIGWLFDGSVFTANYQAPISSNPTPALGKKNITIIGYMPAKQISAVVDIAAVKKI